MVDKRRPRIRCYERFSYGVISTTERFFYALGQCIAEHPVRTIILCWTFVAISSLGMLRFYQERDPMRLWVPGNSQFKRDADWLMGTLDNAFRVESVILRADDVLTPAVIQHLFRLDQRMRSAISSKGYSYADVCFQIPEMDASLMMLLNPPNKRRKHKDGRNQSDEDEFDPSVHFNEHTYCQLVESMDLGCYAQSVLDLWQNNERKIAKLTKEMIVDRINVMKEDPLLKNLKNYESLLGDVQRNATGHIISARALRTSWMTNLNFTAVKMDDVGNMAGTTEWASTDVLDWENVFLQTMKDFQRDLEENEPGLTLFYTAGRSFGDISGKAMFQGIEVLFLGSVIMLLYVQFVISKFNWVEMRAVLGGVGLLSVGMALVAGCGICALCGVPFGPIHTSLPFLLMGLGVDDMFVIVACWDHLTAEERKRPLPERVGIMLREAGVSITVTTATDVLAFVVGSTTVLPSLRSYCLYTAVGVLLTFVFVVTFFVACFTIDQKRLENCYNGVLPWIKYENYKPNKFSQAGTSQKVFHTVYSKVILTWPGKLAVVLVTLICLGFSIEGCLKLEQRFDPTWFIPDHTYMGHYLAERAKYYPTWGYEASTFIGAVNYSQELSNIQNMDRELDNCTDIISNIVSWSGPFRDYVYKIYRIDIYKQGLSDDQFHDYLSKFLFTPKGARFQANFKFDKPLKCGQPASKILLTNFDYIFKRFAGPTEHVPAMRRIMRISKELNLTTGDRFSTSWSRVYATWITDEIIDVEVLRNIQLALIAVMVTTSLLIANVQICFWVFVMIILSMVNVCGFMQRWGVTIDIVSCVALQLAIGLCVDYATHIGHKFLTISEGNNHERILKTVTCIGSAVLYGGCSTLIGVTMLGFSDSYNFRTFFKIFLLVVIFGLFNGVVLLPVILSWIGPKPYNRHKRIPSKPDVNAAEVEAHEVKPINTQGVLSH